MIFNSDLGFPFEMEPALESYEWRGTEHSKYRHVICLGGYCFVEGRDDDSKFMVEAPSEEGCSATT